VGVGVGVGVVVGGGDNKGLKDIEQAEYGFSPSHILGTRARNVFGQSAAFGL
jgi:hypothetical protein